MERLTIPDVRINKHTSRRTMIDTEAVRERAMEIYWRLKSYEDTGLTPDQVLNAKTIIESAFSDDTLKSERIRELLIADKENRVVVLPCEIGDEVYTLQRKRDGSDCVATVAFGWSDIPRLGRTIFLTYAEGKKALAKWGCMGENDAAADIF